MKKTYSKKMAQKNNIATIVVCALVIISVSLAIFLSGFDWHSESVLGGFAPIGHSASIGDAIPEAEKEDWDYFDDTVFVGDSITYGMASYGYLSFNHVFAKIGLHQGTALTSKCVYTSKTNTHTIFDALEMAKPGKVIVTLGINAIYSYKEDYFYNNYRSLINKIKAATPDSKIIIQSIFPVTETYAERNGRPDYNQHIAYANRELAKLSKELDCYFLHTYEKLTDENGYLQSKFSGDGLHLSRDGYTAVFDYILSHPIVSSGYFTEIGAVRPPYIPSTSSQVELPDIGTVSGLASSEGGGDVQSSIAESETESSLIESNGSQDSSSDLVSSGQDTSDSSAVGPIYPNSSSSSASASSQVTSDSSDVATSVSNMRPWRKK